MACQHSLTLAHAARIDRSVIGSGEGILAYRFDDRQRPRCFVVGANVGGIWTGAPGVTHEFHRQVITAIRRRGMSSTSIDLHRAMEKREYRACEAVRAASVAFEQLQNSK